MEYRVLSNYFLTSDELLGWTWDNTKAAIKFINEDRIIDEEDELQIQLAINNNLKDVAQTLINKYNIKLPASVQQLQTV